MAWTIEQAIAESIRAEKAAGNLYQGLVHKFSAEPEVADFWNQFALEEANHLEWLNDLTGRLSKSELENRSTRQPRISFTRSG